MKDQQFIEQQFTQIEQYLKSTGLWSDDLPTDAAMASRVPFAADSMEFEQWLQFIYLPQMRQYVKDNEDVPANMGVAPMAHQVLSAQHRRLVHLLLSLDNLSKQRND